jgi:hypothetical protein
MPLAHGTHGAAAFVGQVWRTVRVVQRLAEEPAMSTTTGPQASDDDKNEPGPQDVEKSAGKEKAVAGAEIGIMPEGEGSSFEPEEDPEAQS